MWVNSVPNPVQYHAVVHFRYDTGQANATIVIWLRQISRFGNWDDVREGPYVGLDVIYQCLVADLEYDVVEIAVFGDFWGDTVRPSTFSLLQGGLDCGKLRSCKGAIVNSEICEDRRSLPRLCPLLGGCPGDPGSG